MENERDVRVRRLGGYSSEHLHLTAGHASMLSRDGKRREQEITVLLLESEKERGEFSSLTVDVLVDDLILIELFVEHVYDFSFFRTNRKQSNSYFKTSLARLAAQHCRSSSHSSTTPYLLLIWSATDILFRFTEGLVGQVEQVQDNYFRQVRRLAGARIPLAGIGLFRQIMSTRQSNQENSSIFESNRSRRQQQPTPSNIPSNQQQEPLNSSPSHSDQDSKACCFCWCCCCSCSWYV